MAPGYDSIRPLDQVLSLPQRSPSYEMQRRLAEEVVRGPFDEAIESIKKTTGNVIAKGSAEAMISDAAMDVNAFYAERAFPLLEEAGTIVAGSVDGKGVPMVKSEKTEHKARRTKGEKATKKKMATVATVFTAHPRVRTPLEVVASFFDGQREEESRQKLLDKRVFASLERSKEDVIQEMAVEMKARNPDSKKQRVVLTDGERALQMRVKHTLPDALLILDFFHASEKLWAAAHAFYAEGSNEALQWVRKHALMILCGKAGQVVKGMTQSATKRKLRGAKKKTITDAARYLYRNRDRMHYDEYLKQGLPIASGVVEGACKNLVKDRMERSGMRWKISGAEAVLQLRGVKLSGHMDEYWRFHIQREQERLYGKIAWKIIDEK